METNYIEINYKNKPVNILRYISESNSQFNAKLDYIKKIENNKNNIEWKEANRLSKIWHCIKYKKCRYAPEIYHKVMFYEKQKQ
jgi:hypothetical protein